MHSCPNLILVCGIERNLGNFRALLTNGRYISKSEFGKLQQGDLRCVTGAVSTKDWDVMLTGFEFSPEMLSCHLTDIEVVFQLLLADKWFSVLASPKGGL